MEAYKPVRLSVLAASREFGLSRTALKARLGDVQPGDDNCYSIKQVADAIHGDSKRLKDETEIERCRWYKLRNEALEGRLLDRAALESGLKASYLAAQNVVKGSNLSKRDQKDILQQLAQCPVVLENVARAQAVELKAKPAEGPDDE